MNTKEVHIKWMLEVWKLIISKHLKDSQVSKGQFTLHRQMVTNLNKHYKMSLFRHSTTRQTPVQHVQSAKTSINQHQKTATTHWSDKTHQRVCCHWSAYVRAVWSGLKKQRWWTRVQQVFLPLSSPENHCHNQMLLLMTMLLPSSLMVT